MLVTGVVIFMTGGLNEMASAAPIKNKDVIELWPGVAPGSEHSPAKYTVVERSKSAFFPDRAVTGITKPSLTVFKPEHPNGTSMIVAPGGAYSRIVLDKESGEMAKWLNPLGVTVFVLQYRLPAEGHVDGSNVPLEDGQRAIRVVRQNSHEWGLDPNRIGLLGCSAAGHLAASIGAEFNKKVYERVDQADSISARPDFLVLMYPVVSMDEKYTHMESRINLIGKNPTEDMIKEYSPNLHITKDAPKTFIALANNDSAVSPENGVLYYMGLHEAGVEAELHVFKDGDHGFGIDRIQGLPGEEWPELCHKWMVRIGMLNK